MCFVKRPFWRVKWQCLENFYGTCLEKNESCCVYILWPLRDQSNSNHAVSQIIFSQNLQCVKFWLLNHRLWRKEWTGNNHILLPGFKLEIRLEIRSRKKETSDLKKKIKKREIIASYNPEGLWSDPCDEKTGAWCRAPPVNMLRDRLPLPSQTPTRQSW